MKQLVQEHKSLWRITNNYTEDSGNCDECKALWEKMRTDKEANIASLTELLKQHLG